MENSEKKTDKAEETVTKTGNKAENIKEENKKETAEKETAVQPAEDEEEDEDVLDNLFNRRISVPLTPDNARFTLSDGKLISLELTKDNGEKEFFERVIIRRSFPITAPEEFLSVREPDTREKGTGGEIGMIRSLSLFDAETVRLINDELAVRYFTPEITRIVSAKDKNGTMYWDLETSAGSISTMLNRPYSNIRQLEDERVFITDMNGNCFYITDVSKLDRYSRRVLEIYL